MIVRTPRDIGSLIRARRHALGWDQQTLADRIGVGRLWVIEVERGKPGAKLDLILRALQALGVQIDALTPGDRPQVVTDPVQSRSGALIDRLLGDDDR